MIATKRVDDLTHEEINEQVALCQGFFRVDKGVFFGESMSSEFEPTHYDPCHNAQQVFKIIEHNKISILFIKCFWQASIFSRPTCTSEDRSFLVSAMKCCVKSIKGETVEI